MKTVIVFMVALAALYCQGQDNTGTQSSDAASQQAATGEKIECYGVICNPGTMQCAARVEQGSNSKNWSTIVECLDENGNVLNHGVTTNQGDLANAHKETSTEKNGFGIVIGDPSIFSGSSGKIFKIGGLSISGGLVFGSGGSEISSDNGDSRKSSNNGGLDSFFGKGGSGNIFGSRGSGNFLGNNGFGNIFGNRDSGNLLGNGGFGNLPSFASNGFSSANGSSGNPAINSGNSGSHSSNQGSGSFSGSVDPGSYISTSTNSSSFIN